MYVITTRKRSYHPQVFGGAVATEERAVRIARMQLSDHSMIPGASTADVLQWDSEQQLLCPLLSLSLNRLGDIEIQETIPLFA